ncbi:helix-turn-helix domain-containing protein [Streptomyces sp. NPDC016566]|uniref:MmyB family transcriptional regulator n=1 Tax=Streptomyces sp. NPDC016566 TaxID=3364967 RepID=UPI0036F9879B
MGEQVLGRHPTAHSVEVSDAASDQVGRTPQWRWGSTAQPLQRGDAVACGGTGEPHQDDTAEGLAAEIRAKRLQDFLKGRREYLDLSQKEIAERLMITDRAYGNWERGRVKEWTDEKLHLLAQALEMSEFQTTRLFWLAVDRGPLPHLRATSRRTHKEDPATAALLYDYCVMMDALSLPTFLIDHRWDIRMTNKAYRELFHNLRPHPTAMPCTNFLRFGLFHPDAPTILVDHLKWQLAMLATLASSLERHDDDTALHTIRQDVYRHPALRDAYLKDMPNWVLGCGEDLVHHEGRVRELRHPDPQVGIRGCRLVEETPQSLQVLGLTRITLVLVDPEARHISEQHGSHNHHAA